MGNVRRAYLMAAPEQYSQMIVRVVMIAALTRLLDATEIGVAVKLDETEFASALYFRQSRPLQHSTAPLP